jgi:integrase
LTATGDPNHITPTMVVRWATDNTRANNTVRQRLQVARNFLNWCHRHDHTAKNIATDPAIVRCLRSHPSTYGKQQAANPPNWLDRAEADRLIENCQDGTLRGLRDEIIVRFGLLGMRAGEIRKFRIRNLDLRTDKLRWTGKYNKPREATVGPKLREALARYLSEYVEHDPDDVLLCARPNRNSPDDVLQWREPMAPNTVYYMLQKRTPQGLGHVAPHDLRRSAAGILHRAKSADGGHKFDLLDIQKVLGHSDPATTMKCYLDPMDTGAIDRAADYLD